MTPLREALIRPSAISHNVQALRTLTPSAHTLAVVKADGYGHGAITASRAALEGGATWLGTADITEALEIRSAGITAPILAWLFGPGEDLSPAYDHGIDLGVSSPAQLRQASSLAQSGRPQRVHLKVDTGLTRSGASESTWAEFFEQARTLQDKGAIEIIGFYTHLSGTSEAADTAQGEAFERAWNMAHSQGLEPQIRHVAASLGQARTPALAHDMVRLGIATYGISQDSRHDSLGLQPAMRVSAPVVLVKRVPAGVGVGYGHTYRTSSDTTMALVPLGYADGIPRHASNTGPVVINGQRFSVSGRVSMDQISIDVGDHPVKEGDTCVIFGDPFQGEPSVRDWSEAAGTIGYEIITRIGPRVVRVVQE